jgi:hypothetical protein
MLFYRCNCKSGVIISAFCLILSGCSTVGPTAISRGMGWFLYLRLYGPEEPYFEETWIPGDAERMK